jgi:acyl carrier protein
MMTTEELLSLIAKALKVDAKNITLDSKSESLEEWDSLGHLNILVQLDKATNGKASEFSELVEANSVSDFKSILKSKNVISD